MVASITVPNIIQSTQNKEFHSALKKNISVIENALRLAQIEEGLMGDNTAIFTPTNDSERSYQSAVRLSKYVNTIKLCKHRNIDGCRKFYYDFYYSVKEHDNGVMNPSGSPKLILTDGTIYAITQYEDCESQRPTCQKDQYGNCKKDENGNDIMGNTWNKKACAYIYLDVNGTKGPNKYGRDIFLINVNRNNLLINSSKWVGGTTGKNIIQNKI